MDSFFFVWHHVLAMLLLLLVDTNLSDHISYEQAWCKCRSLPVPLEIVVLWVLLHEQGSLGNSCTLE